MKKIFIIFLFIGNIFIMYSQDINMYKFDHIKTILVGNRKGEIGYWENNEIVEIHFTFLVIEKSIYIPDPVSVLADTPKTCSALSGITKEELEPTSVHFHILECSKNGPASSIISSSK